MDEAEEFGVLDTTPRPQPTVEENARLTITPVRRAKESQTNRAERTSSEKAPEKRGNDSPPTIVRARDLGREGDKEEDEGQRLRVGETDKGPSKKKGAAKEKTLEERIRIERTSVPVPTESQTVTFPRPLKLWLRTEANFRRNEKLPLPNQQAILLTAAEAWLRENAYTEPLAGAD